MKNTYWLEYVHKSFVKKGFVPKEDFKFDEVNQSKLILLPREERDKARLMRKRDVIKKDVSYENVSKIFGEKLEETLFYEDCRFSGGDDCKELELFRLQSRGDDVGEIIRVIFGRDIFRGVRSIFSQDVCAINLLEVNYLCKDGFIDYGVYLGEDFSALDLFSTASSASRTGSREDRLMAAIFGAPGDSELTAKLHKINANKYDPKEAADFFIEMVYRLRERKIKQI